MRSATKRFEKKPNVKNMGEKWRRPKYDMSKNRPRYPTWQAEKLVIKFSSSYYTYNKSQKKMKIMSKVDCWQNQSLNLALVEKVEYCISMRARKKMNFSNNSRKKCPLIYEPFLYCFYSIYFEMFSNSFNLHVKEDLTQNSI